MMKPFKLLITTAVCVIACSVQAQSINENTRQLAGLAPTNNATLDAHLKNSEKTWSTVRTTRLNVMNEFARAQLGKEQAQCDTLLYPFGGPDILNPTTWFPNCKNYLMFGLEPVGTLPAIDPKHPEHTVELIKRLDSAQTIFLRRNFFVTNYMSKDLHAKDLNGVLPLMLVTLARQGYAIDNIEYKNVDGSKFEDPKAIPHGVDITVHQEGKSTQTISYVRFDASDAGLKAKPAFLQRMQNVHPTVTMLKAASYLMHDPTFSTMRNLVLDKSPVIVQDDTGIPLSALVDRFDMQYFGFYHKPIDLFTYRYQKDLDVAFDKHSDKKKLPFAWSYNWNANDTGLMIARKKAK